MENPKHMVHFTEKWLNGKNCERFFREKSCIFVGNWAKKLRSQILCLKKVGKRGILPIPNS